MKQPSIKKQLRDAQQIIGQFAAQTKTFQEEATYVVNALCWKLGIKDKKEAQDVVDEYTKVMHQKYLEQQAAIKKGAEGEEGGKIVFNNFLHEKNPVQEEGQSGAPEVSEPQA